MGLAETAELSVRIGLDDKLSPGLRKVNGQLGKFESSTKRIGSGVGKIGAGFAKAGLVAGGFAVVGLAGAAKAAIDFEDAFQGVVKTVDADELKAAGLTFEGLSESIRKMSLEMPNSAIELAGIAEAAGALGIKAGDIEAFTKQVAILASTTDVSAEDAAMALGQLQNVIGLTGDEFDNFAAALVDLGNKGASTESQILEIARRAGGAAKLFGIGKDEILGWSAAAANLGINSELAGTSLQRIFLQLMPKINSGSKALSKVMGRSAKDIKRLFAKDAGRALELFVRKLAKLPKDARLDAIQDIFGKGTGISRLLLGLTGDVDGLSESLDTSKDAWKDAAAAAAEFEKRNQTVKSAFARLKNGILDAAVSIGEGFAPALGRAADKLADFLKQDKNRQKLKDFGREIGAFIDRIDFDKAISSAEKFIDAVKPVVGVIGKIAEAIAKLPPEVIGVGGATILADRLSGGAVSSGVGGAVGGLAEAFAKSMAARIPLFGRAFVQPVFVTNMGVGLPGGGGGKPIPTPGIRVPAMGAGVALDMVIAQERTNDALARLDAKSAAHRAATISGTAQVTANERGEQAKLRAVQAANVAKVNAAIAAGTNARNMNERGEQAKARAKLDAIKAKEQESLVAFRAGERAINASKALLGGKLNTANERLAQIRAKKMYFSTNVNVGVSTAVSVSAFQQNARVSSRVARTTRNAVS